MTAGDDRSLSMTVVDEVAKREGVDPVQLSEPLSWTIDPEALDSLFTNGSGTVTFEYLGYRITVARDGTTTVEPTAEKNS